MFVMAPLPKELVLPPLPTCKVPALIVIVLAPFTPVRITLPVWPAPLIVSGLLPVMTPP